MSRRRRATIAVQLPGSRRAPRARTRVSVAAGLALSGAIAALSIGAIAVAQSFPGDHVPARPIRLEGSWGHTNAEPQVIGEVTLSRDGKDRRTFGVTAIQAYDPEEEGMQILRHSSLQPTLLLRGRDEMIARLYAAKPDQKVTLDGVYGAGNGNLTLSSVEVGG